MKMEFDSEQIANYLKQLKQCRLLMEAHREVLESVWREGPQDLDDRLSAALARLVPRFDREFDEAIENLLKLPTDAERAQRLSQYLELWTPPDRRPT